MTDAAPDYHIPVLLQTTVDGLNVDCTFGGGGHSREILRRLGPNGRLLAFDQDADAQRNIPAGEDRLTFVQSNFRYLPNWLHYYGYAQVDGILADLGVSSHHFDAADRGFSFRFEGALDMRMNKMQDIVPVEKSMQHKTRAHLSGRRRQYVQRRAVGKPVLSLRRTQQWAPLGRSHHQGPRRRAD